MNLVNSIQGVSAYRVTADDTLPLTGVAWPDVKVRLIARFRLADSSGDDTLILQNGVFENGDARIPVKFILLSAAGAAVQSQTTEQADVVLEHLIEILDSEFGFRISASNPRRDRASQVVVEFEDAVETHLRRLAGVVELVKSHVFNSIADVSVKRLAIGRELPKLPDGATQQNELAGLDGVDRLDFVLERRVNSPFQMNRYYSGAPISTGALLRLLAQIEECLRGT